MRSTKVVYNIITNLVLQIIVIIYGFIVPKIIISTYGSTVNGLISSITQFLAYITLLESGFGPVVRSILYKPIAKKNNQELINILYTSEKFFKRIACFFIVYILILCIFYPLIVSKDFDFFYTISLIVIISISTFSEYFFGMTYRIFLQANQQNYIINIIQMTTYILSIVLILILARIGVSVHTIKLLSTIVFVFRPLLQNLYVKKKYNLDLSKANHSYKIKQKWDALSQHIAAVITGNTDITVLSIFLNLSYVSIYSVYYLVVKGVNSLIQSLTNGIDASFGDMIAKGEYNNLNSKFRLYELLCITATTIIYSCTYLLITPFIMIYTKNITDANYIQYGFGFLLVISQFIWAIRLPYSTLIMASGRFKETQIGAWIEAFSNIFFSIVFVKFYGIIGVVIGTIISMLIRTIEFIYHSNKYILKRNLSDSLKKIFLVIYETLLIFLFSKLISLNFDCSYFNWFINAIVVSLIASCIVLLNNFIFLKKDMKLLYYMILKKIKKIGG